MLIAFNSASGQDFSFREYGVRDGLPQSEAFVVYQDSRGFIWISTKNGLSRFDGIDFVNYHIKDGLPYNQVTSIFEDSESKLWALTYKGLSLYEDGRFLFFPPDEKFSESIMGGVPSPSVAPASAYFLIENRETGKRNIGYFEAGKYSDISSRYKALDSINVGDLYYDISTSELVLLSESRNVYSWKNEELVKLPVRNAESFVHKPDIVLIKAGERLLAYKNGFFTKYVNDEELRLGRATLKVPGNQLKIEYFDTTRNVTIDIPFNPSSLFTDSEGTVWLSSESNMYRLLSPAYKVWSHETMGMEIPWAICPDRSGNLWLGSIGGDLKYFDGQVFRSRDDYKNVIKGKTAFYKGSRLMSNGEVWISTNHNVTIHNGKTFKDIKALRGYQICYIYEDPDDGRVMIGTDRGLFTMKDGQIDVDERFSDKDLGVIEGIVKDNEGFYWLSGHRGLLKMYDDKIEKVEDKVLPDFFTYTIEKDNSGGLWISSEEGLFYKGPGEKEFQHGLPEEINRPVNAVRIINESYLLAGRITDICLIDLDKFYKGVRDCYRIFDISDGYPGSEVLDNGIVPMNETIIWLLTTENLVRFDMSRIKKNSFAPKLNITGFYFETDSQTWEPVRKGGFYYGIPRDLRLKRNENRIMISFSGISFSNPEKVKYSYLLKETDKEWSPYSEKREVVFRSLESGDHTFMIKAINADGIENPEPLVLKFTIAKAFWETILFNVVLVIIIIIVTVLLTNLIIKRNHKIKEEKQKLRSELLLLQMSSFLKEFDPHFTFNAISSVGSLIMKNDRKNAYLYLTRLSSLLRSSLRDSTTLLKTIAEEIDFVRNYCEIQKLRFGDRFNYIITISDDTDQNKEIPKMSIQTFVENAIKHGIENRKEGGLVEINVSRINGYHKFVIRDNGIGREASDKIKSDGTGYGIKTVRRIFEILNMYNSVNSTLDIRDVENDISSSGTEVTVMIPDNYNFSLDESAFAGYTEEPDIV